MTLKDQTWGLGANAGVLIEPVKGTRVGLTYLSQVDLDLKDNPTFRNLGPGLSALLRNPAQLNLGVHVPQSVMLSLYRFRQPRRLRRGQHFGPRHVAAQPGGARGLYRAARADLWSDAAHSPARVRCGDPGPPDREARYRALVENAPVGIVKQRHGTIEFANRAFVSLVGANGAEELTGVDLLGLVAPEHRGEAAATVVALSTGPAFQAIRRLRLQRRDGSFIETEMTGLSSEENGAWAGQMIFVDVTEQRQAEERLRLSRDRLLEQQRTMSAVLCSEEFGRGGDEGVRLLTEVSAKYLDVDRVSLWRFDDDRHSLTCVDLYDRAAGRHRNGEILPVEQCPRYVEAITTEEAIVADDAVTDELTRELAEAGEVLPRLLGILARPRSLAPNP